MNQACFHSTLCFMYVYYILCISEATVARLHRTVCAGDSSTLYSETSMCVCVCVLLVLCTCVAVKEYALFAIVR